MIVSCLSDLYKNMILIKKNQYKLHVVLIWGFDSYQGNEIPPFRRRGKGNDISFAKHRDGIRSFQFLISVIIFH